MIGKVATLRRRRPYRLARSGSALLVSGVVVPTVLGSAVIATMAFWALPTGADLSHRHVLVLNIIATAIYTLIAIPAGVIWGYLWLPSPLIPTKRPRPAP